MMRTVCLCLWVGVAHSFAAQNAVSQSARPTAIVAGSEPETLLIADAVGGRVMRVNLGETPEVAEFKIGESLVDLKRVSADRFVAIDRKLRQLICFRFDGRMTILERDRLDLDPSRLAVSDQGEVVCVTSRWSCVAQLVRLSETSRSRALVPIDIGFEGHEILSLPGGGFLVADAFGGRLCVIDADDQRVETTQTLRGHNIRGLAVTNDGASVLVSHQILSRVARSDFDDVHWGSLMQNVVSRIPIAALSLPPAGFHQSIERVSLGDVGRGFADPTDVVALPDGFAVLSGGARQLSIYNGRKLCAPSGCGTPSNSSVVAVGGRLAVANEHDGAISLVSLIEGVNDETIRLGSGGASPVSTGEAAFYDASLSHDSWMTCSSCHVDGHTPGLLADTLGDGSFGDAKRIPSLLGAKATRPYGWLGNQTELSDQIAATLSSTMHADDAGPEVIDDLVGFLESLEAPPPVAQEVDTVKAGRQLFVSLRCGECSSRPRTYIGDRARCGLGRRDGQPAVQPTVAVGAPIPPSVLSRRPHVFFGGRVQTATPSAG